MSAPFTAASSWKVHLTAALLLASLLGSSGYTLVDPLLRECRSLRTQQRQQQELLARGPEIRAEHEQLVAELDSLQETIRQVNLKIPATPQEAEFLEAVARKAGERQITIQEYRPAARDGDAQYVLVVCSARGGYSDLCAFLDDLNHLPRLSRIMHLRVQALEPDQPPYPFELHLRIYFRPPTSPVPATQAT